MQENNMDFNTIDEYIGMFSPEIREILTEIRRVIREAAPEAKEKISYRMPTYDYYGNLVHFAAYQKHIGFYPAPTGIEKFQEELSHYKGAKGSVQFPVNKPIPYDLIHRITLYRVEENRKSALEKGKLK